MNRQEYIIIIDLLPSSILIKEYFHRHQSQNDEILSLYIHVYNTKINFVGLEKIRSIIFLIVT